MLCHEQQKEDIEHMSCYSEFASSYPARTPMPMDGYLSIADVPKPARVGNWICDLRLPVFLDRTNVKWVKKTAIECGIVRQLFSRKII